MKLRATSQVFTVFSVASIPNFKRRPITGTTLRRDTLAQLVRVRREQSLLLDHPFEHVAGVAKAKYLDESEGGD